jgi:hypothetical protein
MLTESLYTNGISTQNVKAKGTATALETAMETAIAPVRATDQAEAHKDRAEIMAEVHKVQEAAGLTALEEDLIVLEVDLTALTAVVTMMTWESTATTVYQDLRGAVF